MKRKFIITLAFFTILALNGQVSAQFTPQEVAQRAEWEEFLKTAEIIGHEDIPEGVNKPIRLYLKKGEVQASGAWKNPQGIQKGFLEGWQYEIAAYRMDKLLGLNLIPPTVEREFKGKRGSLQLWAESQYSLLDIMDQNISFPSSADIRDRMNKMKYLTRAFDSLIANEDRTQQNILYTQDWRLILIDHSRSFRSSERFSKRLMFGKNGIQGRKMIRKLPRVFVEKIKALDFDSIKKAVGPYLEDEEIKAVLLRKKLLLDEIEEMIKEKGEDQFLY
ncbi:MAG: hypothetical protein ACLFVG_10665 [Candidatus Aminicenantes bacterium]